MHSELHLKNIVFFAAFPTVHGIRLLHLLCNFLQPVWTTANTRPLYLLFFVCSSIALQPGSTPILCTNVTVLTSIFPSLELSDETSAGMETEPCFVLRVDMV